MSPRNLQDARLEEIQKIMRAAVRIQDAVPSDEEVVREEKAFIRRFGFDWPKMHRRALIELKREKDLTDGEIKLFRLTGDLVRDPWGVRLNPARWMSVSGWTMLMGTIPLYGGLIFAGLVRQPLMPDRIAGALILLLGLAAMSWAFFQVYIRPWRIHQSLKQREAVRRSFIAQQGNARLH